MVFKHCKREIMILVAILVAGIFVWAFHVSWSRPDKVHEPIGLEHPPLKCELTPDGLLAYINAERAKLGVQQLTVDPRLVTTSGQKIDAMVAEQYFGHDSPSGIIAANLIAAQGLYGIRVSENVNMNSCTDDNSWRIFKNSAPHYASLIDATYDHIGISVRSNLNYVIKKDTYVTDNNDTTGKTVSDLAVIHLADE